MSPRRPLRILVSAGPTREWLDPVRYLSNASSGKMGFSIAAEAARRGCSVTLVAGPVALETPEGVRRIDVESAREMLAVLRREFRGAEVLFMAAAVADWRAARRLGGKWRAKDGGAARARLELVRNPDVVATLARRKGARRVVAFALETGCGLRRALGKLARKNADFIVLNDASVLNSERATVTILGQDGSVQRVERRTKRAVAAVLVDLVDPPRERHR